MGASAKPNGLSSPTDPSRKRGAAALREHDPELVKALIAAQPYTRCRVITHRPPQTFSEMACGHVEKYHGHVPHEFDGGLTCASCKHMGRRYWGSDDHPVHFCGREKERRAAGFVDQGSFGDNFMAEWRKFYDAGPTYSAEKCAYFEPRELQAIATVEDEGAGPKDIAQ